MARTKRLGKTERALRAQGIDMPALNVFRQRMINTVLTKLLVILVAMVTK